MLCCYCYALCSGASVIISGFSPYDKHLCHFALNTLTYDFLCLLKTSLKSRKFGHMTECIVWQFLVVCFNIVFPILCRSEEFSSSRGRGRCICYSQNPLMSLPFYFQLSHCLEFVELQCKMSSFNFIFC